MQQQSTQNRNIVGRMVLQHKMRGKVTRIGIKIKFTRLVLIVR